MPNCEHFGERPSADQDSGYADLFCACHTWEMPRILAGGTNIAWPAGWTAARALAWRENNGLTAPTPEGEGSVSSSKNPENEVEVPAPPPEAGAGKKPRMAPQSSAPPGLEQDGYGNAIPFENRTPEDQEKAAQGRK
jgi:hypothetical protein